MYCWICDTPVDAFLPYGVPARRGRCPRCGAKPRGRLLGWLLEKVLAPRLPAGARMLEAGASGFSVRRLLAPRFTGAARASVIDIRVLDHHRGIRAPHGFARMDIQGMGFPGACFDLILCNNVLPYVPDDRRALGEIRRCLKPGGLALINTHREPGPTLSVPEHRSLNPGLSDAYYAANGDQRVYGGDFLDRVAGAGLGWATAVAFGGRGHGFLRDNGLKRRDEMILAFTEAAALERCRHPELDITATANDGG